MSNITVKQVKGYVADFLAGRQVAISTQQVLNVLVMQKNRDSMIERWAAEIADQATDAKMKNGGLSAYRGQLKRAAKANELDVFPTVKAKDNSYAVEWREIEDQDDSQDAIREAFKAFLKTPNSQAEEKELLKQIKAYKAATAKVNAAPESTEILDESFDDTDSDAAELIEAVTAMQG